MGVGYVIIGHSERRQKYFGETNKTINDKLKAAFDSGLIPIMCVGETLEEHHRAQNVVQEQLSEGLDGITENQALKMIIAYEPVWAIGTGQTATPEEAGDMHAFIRGVIIDKYSYTTKEKMRILYGGSVKPDNISALMRDPDIDGALIGGASLKSDSFVKMIEATYNLYKDKEFIQK